MGQGIRLPRLISSGMVLQREAQIRIWGWAHKGACVRVELAGRACEAAADGRGEWAVSLPPMPAGGPYAMRVSSGGDALELTDVLIGDVWMCSGQSNMELPMARVAPRYGGEVRVAGCDGIRQFLVPKRAAFAGPERDYPAGEWERVGTESIPRFFALSYFFARRLHARYGVPIGLINCAAGGSKVESWMSEQALRAFPDVALKWRDPAAEAEARAGDEARTRRWQDDLDRADEGLKQGWREGFRGGEETDPTADWAEHVILKNNGAFWFEHTFDVSRDAAGQEALLLLGCVRDADFAYVNGELVGSTEYQYPPRRYPLRAGLLRPGRNTLIVRAVSMRGVGGFTPEKPYRIETPRGVIGLSGRWRMRVGAIMPEPMAEAVFFEGEPVGLFNAMLAPITRYAIRGAIWYQGESNARDPSGYAARFRAMVAEWRALWGIGEFPFLYVQLANYKTPHVSSDACGWPELREQQRACLDVANAAMAVGIDVGEWNDLHPLNKCALGARLALAARRLSYMEDIEHSGPLPKNARRVGESIRVCFDHARGLRAEGGPPTLMLAGDDRIFAPSPARIEGDAIIIDRAPQNVRHIRYAWADSPCCALLYNAQNLPATPFEIELCREEQR